jgi:hypothetical protein
MRPAGALVDLTPSQIATFEGLLGAGFRFVTLPRYERYLGVERDGFAALIDPSDGHVRVFGQTGRLLGDGLAMLIERDAEKTFVWHKQSVAATPELLAAYDRFRADLQNLLQKE